MQIKSNNNTREIEVRFVAVVWRKTKKTASGDAVFLKFRSVDLNPGAL